MKIDPNSQTFPNEEGARGITKREYLIAKALQGLLASNPTLSVGAAARLAIEAADETIYRLNAEQ